MNLNQMMKQAQKMKQEMEKKQEELSNRVYDSQSGGGMVTAKVNGRYEVVALKIDPEIVKQGDVEMIEDLVTAAINEGFKKVQEELQQTMSGLIGGLGGLGGLSCL